MGLNIIKNYSNIRGYYLYSRAKPRGITLKNNSVKD